MATIKAGTYVFVEAPTMPSAMVQLNFDGKAKYTRVNSDGSYQTELAANVYGCEGYATNQAIDNYQFYVQYGGDIEYVVYGANGWRFYNDDDMISVADTTKLRTIKVLQDVTDVSDDFYTWFTANTISNKLSVDLTTLPGWANLSSGNHVIKLKAKGSNYRDSELSEGVVVNKAGAVVTIIPVVKSTESIWSIIQNLNQSKIYTVAANPRLLSFQTPSVDELSSICAFKYVNGLWTIAHQTFDSYIISQTSNSITFNFGVEAIPKGKSENDYTYYAYGVVFEADEQISRNDISKYATEVSRDIARSTCIVEGTLITLANGTKKPIQDITYDDDLLVWNFYEGKIDTAKPCWIKVEQVAPEYNLCKFSNGVEVGFVGEGGNTGYHRIYNDEAKCFTHTGVAETPVGTTTFAEDSTMPKLISQEVVKEPVKFYNIITDKHYNLFANGILTSCRLSNKYKIEDMKYVGECLITEQEEKEYFDRCERINKQ